MESAVDPEHFECVTPNISPDPANGHMVAWNEDMFVKRFRQGKLIPHSTMPWGPFRNMSDVEIKAIYKYLQTVKPVHNNPGPVVVAKK